MPPTRAVRWRSRANERRYGAGGAARMTMFCGVDRFSQRVYTST